MASTINAQTTPFVAVVTEADSTGNLALQAANATVVTLDTNLNATFANVVSATSFSGALNAANITSGTISTARLASGTANASTYLRGDQTWAAVTTFATGTKTVFIQTTAPTGWTKDTVNYNNHALRVVTGTAGTGGTVDFTTAFASQTPTGSVSISSVVGSAGATTLATTQIPSHAHPVPTFQGPGSINGLSSSFSAGGGGTYSTNNTGGGGSHSHPFSFSSGSGTFSGNAINLAVKYLDVITATKD
jgi:hypothetical protein